MKPCATRILGIALLAALQSDCNYCPDDPCEDAFDLSTWCATSKKCRLDGQLVTHCECCGTTPHCALWFVAPGSVLEYPLDEIWPLLGKRNDLIVSWSEAFGDESNVELFFDGVPETPGMCTRKPGRSTGSVRCFNLPQTVKRLEFRYKHPLASGFKADVYLDMHDKECEDANPACPL